MLIHDFKSRQVRREEKRLAILSFLHDETWSTCEVLRIVSGFVSRQGIHQALSAMQRDGLVVSAFIDIPGGRFQAWGITQQGILMAPQSASEFESRPAFEPTKLSLSKVPHQTALQKLRFQFEKAGWSGWQRGERLGFSVKKRPDAIVESPEGLKVAIEVELTIKTLKRYRSILVEHLQAVKAGHWQEIWYFTNAGVSVRLRNLFQSIGSVLVRGKPVVISGAHQARFRFCDLQDVGSLLNAEEKSDVDR